MGRRPRIHYPGAVYHAMGRGVDGRTIFKDDQDYQRFLTSLDRIKLETNAVIYAYCLMPNHFHLALKVSAVPLGSILQRILTGHALTFNLRYDRTGHLFQARYKSKHCLDDRYLLRLIHYIQMNPVRAGLVKHAADWPWSSRSPVDLPNLDADEFNPWSNDDTQLTLIRPIFRSELTLEEISEKIAATTDIEISALRGRSKCRDIVRARRLVASEGVRQGHGLSSIAGWLNTSVQTVAYYLRTNSTNL